MTQATFFAIFYDDSLPKTKEYAMYKRVGEKTYLNLLDDMGVKEVELKQSDDSLPLKYKVISSMTFQVENTVDNAFFGIFICKRIKQNNLQPTVAKSNH